MRTRIVACLAASVVLPPCAALDAEPLPARDLYSACLEYAEDADSEPARLCDAYVRGFVAGLKSLKAEQASSAETFSERALRTRLGVKPTQACNPQALTPDMLIGQLLAYVAAESEPPDASASELLNAVIQRIQACG